MSDKSKAKEYFDGALEALHLNNDKAGALMQMQAGLLLDPDNVLAWINRGNTMVDMGFAFEGLCSIERGLLLRPDVADFHINRAGALIACQRMGDALEALDKGIAIQPSAQAYANRAVLLNYLGQAEECVEYHRKALALDDHNPDYHRDLGMSLIRMGELEEGWREYEWRLARVKDWRHPFPRWLGEPLDGKGLLVFFEQGNGDVIQFMRYAPLVKAQYPNAKIYLEVRSSLTRLARSMPIDGVIAAGDDYPRGIDYAASMMSMPFMFSEKDESDIPGECPYVSVTPHAKAEWQRRLPRTGLKVGLCWSGMSRDFHRVAKEIDARRSMKLAQWGPILKVPGVQWISLQLGPPAEQIHHLPCNFGFWPEEMGDWYDTAALVSCLDLVITVDTAIAHLAGAMGVPVWMFSRFDGCWRWMGHRNDSPWYPTMRLFHQPKWGDWAPSIEQVRQALVDLTKQEMAA